jgi:hypothetical protein
VGLAGVATQRPANSESCKRRLLSRSIKLALAVLDSSSRPIDALIAVSILVSADALRPFFLEREAEIAAFFGLIYFVCGDFDAARAQGLGAYRQHSGIQPARRGQNSVDKRMR